MKKIITCLLIFCIIANQLLAAETLEGLTYEQERIYLQNQLSVQTSQHTNLSGLGYMNDWGLYTSFSEGETTTEWTPYVGAREISKEAFYEIAGYNDLAEAERSANTFNRNMTIAGWTLYGVGLLAMLSSLFFLDNEAACYGLLCGGGIVAAAGIPLVFIKADNDVSISFAVGIANSYNRKLLESLR